MTEKEKIEEIIHLVKEHKVEGINVVKTEIDITDDDFIKEYRIEVYFDMTDDHREDEFANELLATFENCGYKNFFSEEDKYEKDVRPMDFDPEKGSSNWKVHLQLKLYTED